MIRNTFLMAGFFSAGLFLFGCNNSSQPPTESNSSSEKEAKVASENSPAGSHQSAANPLVGTWLGRAVLNQEMLQAKLDSISDPQEKNQLNQMVQSFLSTQMGAEFTKDGKLVFDIEMKSMDGVTLRDSSWGTWKTMKQNQEFIIIQKTESFSDGSSESKVERYDFVRDQNHFVMTVTTAPALQECQAMIMFERRYLNPSTAPKVAGRPEETSSGN